MCCANKPTPSKNTHILLAGEPRRVKIPPLPTGAALQTQASPEVPARGKSRESRVGRTWPRPPRGHDARQPVCAPRLCTNREPR